MRDTWRRPSKFLNYLRKYGQKARHDMLKNLDKLVENSEYKEAQKYL